MKDLNNYFTKKEFRLPITLRSYSATPEMRKMQMKATRDTIPFPTCWQKNEKASWAQVLARTEVTGYPALRWWEEMWSARGEDRESFGRLEEIHTL